MHTLTIVKMCTKVLNLFYPRHKDQFHVEQILQCFFCSHPRHLQDIQLLLQYGTKVLSIIKPKS